MVQGIQWGPVVQADPVGHKTRVGFKSAALKAHTRDQLTHQRTLIAQREKERRSVPVHREVLGGHHFLSYPVGEEPKEKSDSNILLQK